MKKAFRFPGRHYRNDAVKKRAQQAPTGNLYRKGVFLSACREREMPVLSHGSAGTGDAERFSDP